MSKNVRCSFCGKNIGGLPHTCKYCGKIHCYNHLLPENHNCSGLDKAGRFGFGKVNYHSKKNSRRKGKKHKHKPFHPRTQRFRFPRIRLPRLNSFIISLLLAITTFFLAKNFIGNPLFLWLEVGAWIYFTIFVYRRAFRWANRISMADDFAFFGLRILGAMVIFVGLYIGFFILMGMFFVENSTFIAIPLICLLGGLVLLGAFIAFRTNRRYRVVGFWRA